MVSLALEAWGDESFRTVGVARPSYLLGAVVADIGSCADLRERMRALPRRGSKLHWRDLDDRAKRAVIAAIAEFDVYHVVVVAAPVELRRQERARALCLERLAWQLDGHGVQLLTLETRPQQLIGRDLRTFDALRSKDALRSGLRLEHEQPSSEPMLWIADQVLGAVGDEMAGVGTGLSDALRSSVNIEIIEL